MVTRGTFTGAMSDQLGLRFCENGALFLDEIEDMPTTIQPKFQFLQEGEIHTLGDRAPRRYVELSPQHKISNSSLERNYSADLSADRSLNGEGKALRAS